jgi:electron transport complex protein RnfC
VEKNIPLIERVITVSGEAVKEPKNLLVKTGTPFRELFSFCGGFSEKAAKIIMGGPMMGIAQVGADAVVIKSTSGVLALPKRLIDNSAERPCIRCGRCNDACTMRLRPNLLSILSETGKHQTAQTEFDLLDCVECGCCSSVCPSKRNIVHYIKQSKAKNAMAKSVKK